ncbi:MAG: hypothetical protein CGW95_01615 [Phenylobacterium zucineum]|nr:MAG: hypothetical protein CGW95_01615 [Phenylobacterium zucineum]
MGRRAKAERRRRLEAAIEAALEALDALDGDSDFEPQCEDEGAQCEDEGTDTDREPDTDAEPDYFSTAIGKTKATKRPFAHTRSSPFAARYRQGATLINCLILIKRHTYNN